MAASTSKIPFFATSPKSIISPTIAIILSWLPKAINPSTAPINASGKVNIIDIGSIKLSNCAAITKYNNITERAIAVIKLLKPSCNIPLVPPRDNATPSGALL